MSDIDPAYMEWPDLRKMLWDRLKTDDEDVSDHDLVATRAELLALLSWADKFNRDAQPRRDEEQRTYDIIKRAADLIKPPAVTPMAVRNLGMAIVEEQDRWFLRHNKNNTSSKMDEVCCYDDDDEPEVMGQYPRGDGEMYLYDMRNDAVAKVAMSIMSGETK
jgi:hypothetical protein